MGRAPCCEKMGVKRGPWAPEEDRILTNYIHVYGHGNWRALPKQAGLLRCGKSCRLRWTNYLRPDIKRGNFSKEEEETIIKLHEMLGNRWSVIAGRLPGRTDNEIKNVWHTHLKKRLQQNQQPITHLQETKPSPPPSIKIPNHDQQSSASDTSSVTTTTTTDTATAAATCTSEHSLVNSFQEMDEDFWAEVLSADNSGSDFAQFSPIHGGVENVYGYNSGMHDGMDFWFNLFSTAGELSDLPEF